MYQITTIVQEDCDEEWDHLEINANKLQTNKNYNIWDDIEVNTMDFCIGWQILADWWGKTVII